MDVSAVRRRAARRFMAGPDLADALRREEELRACEVKTMLGYWNGPDEDPDVVAETYLAAVEALAERPDVQYACKVPALGLDRARIATLADRTREAGVQLHFDSLGPEVADAVLEAAVAARAGATLPGRWSRSPADAERLSSTDLPVRVVKGQWPDPVTPRRDAREGFMAVVARLAGRIAPVEVATHDAPLAAEALRVLQRAGTPCELQLVLGLPKDEPLAVAREAGVETRVYVSYGVPYLPYGMRGIFRHPSFIMHLCAGLIWASSPNAF
jgi:proline dehydrogenase